MPREAAARINIHGSDRYNSGLEPQLVDNVKHEDNRNCQDLLEKVYCHVPLAHWRRVAGSHRRHGHPKLSSQDKSVGGDGEPGANQTSLRLIGKLVQGVARGRPSLPEANVAQADAGPGEQAREPADTEEPVKDDGMNLDIHQVGQQGET